LSRTVAFTHRGFLLSLSGLGGESETDAVLSKNDILSQLLITIPPFFAFYHSLSVSLVILFPKLYSVCLQIINDKLKSLAFSSATVNPIENDLFVIKGSLDNESNQKNPIFIYTMKQLLQY